MQREIVNPWTWQDQFGFVQANVVSDPRRVVFCAGQTSVDADGAPLHVGDMTAQVLRALDNLETVLGQSGMGLGDVVRITYYTTDVDAYFGALEPLNARLEAAGCRAAATLLGISRLARPELLVEIEATAVA